MKKTLWCKKFTLGCTMSSTLGQCRPGTSVPQWGLPKRQVEKVPLSPGKSGLHVRGEGERVIALESW